MLADSAWRTTAAVVVQSQLDEFLQALTPFLCALACAGGEGGGGGRGGGWEGGLWWEVVGGGGGGQVGFTFQ